MKNPLGTDKQDKTEEVENSRRKLKVDQRTQKPNGKKIGPLGGLDVFYLGQGQHPGMNSQGRLESSNTAASGMTVNSSPVRDSGFSNMFKGRDSMQTFAVADVRESTVPNNVTMHEEDTREVIEIDDLPINQRTKKKTGIFSSTMKRMRKNKSDQNQASKAAGVYSPPPPSLQTNSTREVSHNTSISGATSVEMAVPQSARMDSEIIPELNTFSAKEAKTSVKKVSTIQGVGKQSSRNRLKIMFGLLLFFGLGFGTGFFVNDTMCDSDSLSNTDVEQETATQSPVTGSPTASPTPSPTASPTPSPIDLTPDL